MKNKNKNTTRCGNGATKSTHLSDGQSVTPSFGHSLSHPFTHSPVTTTSSQCKKH